MKTTVANRGGSWLRKEKRRAIHLRDRNRCVYCGEKVTVNRTVDHVDPDGPNVYWNLVTACKFCNSSKRNKSLEYFLQALARRGVDIEETKKRLKKVTGKEVKERWQKR